AIYKVIAGVISEPPTKDEVERVKTGLLRQLEDSLSDAQTLGVNGLTTPISQGDWRLMFLQHDRIKNVTPEDLVRVAKTYFKAANRTVGYYIPDAAPDRTVVPETPDLEKLLTGYKSSVTITHGEAFDPTPANIEKRVVRGKLSNGMKVVMLPKQTENSQVTAVIELRFGDGNSLKGNNGAAQFAGSLMGRATLQHTQEQLRDEMQKLNARISVSGGGGGGFGGGRGGRGGGGGGGGVSSANASISVPAANFEAALKLAVEMLKEPVYADSDFDRTLQQRIKALEVAPTEPTQLGAEMLNRHLSPFQPGDAMYSPTREEQLAEMKKVTLEDARRFHDQFYGANFGVLAVVGPVDPAAVKQAGEELLGKWNTSMPYKPIAAEFKAAGAINRKIETPDKANAQFEAGERFAMAESDPDYPAMLLAGYMFGGPITSRVSDRIRNREGLSYGANARVAIPVEGNAAMLSATVSLNPVNGPKVEFSFVDELRKTLKDGFTAAEVTEAKKAYLETRANGRAQDAALLTQMASHAQEDRTFVWDQQLEAKIQALTAEQINAAFRKHIDPAAISIVKAGDFKAAGVYQ
ncbi:MAG: insulinase family protein, partial [Candidatus Sulfopaludibacter sp.]|nr:insulinase family protein [Candidatus Sulfopaludibacter sp.]